MSPSYQIKMLFDPQATLIFSDGACSGNPGPGGWATIVVTPQGQVTELGGSDPSTTNNRMELMGSIRGLESIEATSGKVVMFTDSTYVIRGITQWIWGWRKKGWKTAEGAEVVNQDLWKRLSGALAKRGPEKDVEWKYLRGHSGIPGNERCDQICVAFSKGHRPALYQGSLLNYGVAIHDIPDDPRLTELSEMKPKAGPKQAAFSYLSVVNGTLMKHSTWPECEARVKGRPGAKFKKAMSAEEEAKILREWGY